MNRPRPDNWSGQTDGPLETRRDLGRTRGSRNFVRPEKTIVEDEGVHFSEAAAALLFDKMRTGNEQSSDAEWRVITHGDPAAGKEVLKNLPEELEDLKRRILAV